MDFPKLYVITMVLDAMLKVVTNPCRNAAKEGLPNVGYKPRSHEWRYCMSMAHDEHHAPPNLKMMKQIHFATSC